MQKEVHKNMNSWFFCEILVAFMRKLDGELKYQKRFLYEGMKNFWDKKKDEWESEKFWW